MDDRAVQYGDGCFTTVAVRQGQVQLLDAHIARLQQACVRLNISFQQWPAIVEQLHDQASQHTDAVLKVTISRGKGGRGYMPNDNTVGHFWLSHHSFPVHYTTWQQQGISLGVSDVTLAQQPALAGIKHLNRLEQVLIKLRGEHDYDDWVVCDTQGYVVETSVANLFWLRQGLWFCADLSQCGVAGVAAAQVLTYLAKTGQPAQPVRIDVDELRQAEEMFICNSLMGIVPVREFMGQQYPMAKSRQLQEHWPL